MNPIKIYKEWLNLKTVTIRFGKGCAPYRICDQRRKNDQKRQKMATPPIFSTLEHTTRGLTQENKLFLKVEMFGTQKCYDN